MNKRVRDVSLPSLTVLQAKLNGFSGWLSVDRQCFPSPSPVSQTEASASVWRGGMTEHSRVIAALTLTVFPVPQIEADASI